VRSRFGSSGGVAAGLVLALLGCGRSDCDVVAYTSVDQVFSEPVLRAFEAASGMRLCAVYDTEEAKSTGVMNRLLAERDHPQADVYWANEPIRAESLRQQGLTDPYVSPAAEGIPAEYKDPDGHWTGFSARVRVLLARADLAEKPTSVLDLADPRYRGRAAIANPVFGTTTAEIAALFALKGDAWGREFMASLARNEIRVTASNGESADAVARGEVAFSLVDSDDAVSRIRQGRAVELIVPDQGDGELGAFLVPTAVLVLRGAPHPESGRRLVDFLLSPESERLLAEADCAQIPLRAGVPPPRELPAISALRQRDTHYERVAAKMEEIRPFLENWARR
jgi:iron(III) transport system substrate-binding protein